MHNRHVDSKVLKMVCIARERK